LEEEEEIVLEDVDVDDRACCGKVPAAADVVDAAACSADVDVMKPFCGVNGSSGKNKLDRLSVASIFSLVLCRTKASVEVVSNDSYFVRAELARMKQLSCVTTWVGFYALYH
jgi:hypothetical protein